METSAATQLALHRHAATIDARSKSLRKKSIEGDIYNAQNDIAEEERDNRKDGTTGYAQTFNKVSQDPVQSALPSSATPRQETRLS